MASPRLSYGLCFAISLLFLACIARAASCGLYGSLRHPDLIDRLRIPASNKVTLVSKCEQACMESTEKCLGFAGMARAEEFSIMHYDMSCFSDTPMSSSTAVALNLSSTDQPYFCVPSTKQGVYNPSFEDGLFVTYAHGWSLHGSTAEDKPARYADGVAKNGDTNMIFDASGRGTSSISQTLCVVPALQYELTAFIGHLSHNGHLEETQLYYHAPTVSVFLDQDLIYRSSVCGPTSKTDVTDCQLHDGSYYPISVNVQPRRSTPNLTFEYAFDAAQGHRSYRGLLDLVQLYTAEPPI